MEKNSDNEAAGQRGTGNIAGEGDNIVHIAIRNEVWIVPRRQAIVKIKKWWSFWQNFLILKQIKTPGAMRGHLTTPNFDLSDIHRQYGSIGNFLTFQLARKILDMTSLSS